MDVNINHSVIIAVTFSMIVFFLAENKETPSFICVIVKLAAPTSLLLHKIYIFILLCIIRLYL